MQEKIFIVKTTISVSYLSFVILNNNDVDKFNCF